MWSDAAELSYSDLAMGSCGRIIVGRGRRRGSSEAWPWLWPVRSLKVVGKRLVERMVFLDAKVLVGGDTSTRRRFEKELMVAGLIPAGLVRGSRSATVFRYSFVGEGA